MERISYRVALGGIVSAFCLMGMFLTGVFPLLYLVLPMLAGLLLLIVVEEVGTEWAWLTYFAVGLLSLFVTFDKEAALIFIMFFGCYPILKLYINRIPTKWLRLIVKLLFFNLCMVAYFNLTVYVFGLTELMEAFEDWGKYGGAILLAILNPFFLMYDLSLTNMMVLYRKWLKPRILGRKKK
ncbi:MAG: hypothetical protein J5851_00150 [Oscillospiraceae bacterium]|nr:hypothetical protein [Oscillospiraceae bacterium]